MEIKTKKKNHTHNVQKTKTMNKISVKKMSASWVTLRREFDRNEKAAEDIDILKNHFSSPFFSTRMFCKKKEKKRKKHVVLLKNI